MLENLQRDFNYDTDDEYYMGAILPAMSPDAITALRKTQRDAVSEISPECNVPYDVITESLTIQIVPETLHADGINVYLPFLSLRLI